MADPSEAGRRELAGAMALHRAGDLVAAIRGYRNFLTRHGEHFDALRLLGAALLASNEAEAARSVLDAALRRHAGMPEVWRLHAMALDQLGAPGRACESYRQALALDPLSAPLWSRLGLAQRAAGHLDDALASQRRAAALAPGAGEILCNLVQALLDADAPEEALDVAHKAAALAPDLPEANEACTAALTALARIEEALTACERTIALLESDAPATAARTGSKLDKMRVNHALLLLTLGRFREGWSAFEHRHRLAATAPPGIAAHLPRLRPEDPVAGRRVLLTGEQGLGDTLQFVRFAPALAARGAHLSLAVHPALQGLLSHATGIEEIISEGAAATGLDAFCPIASLPHVLGLDSESDFLSAAYLAPDPNRVDAWRSRLGTRPRGRLRLGLAHAGNQAHRADAHRSMALEQFASLVRPEIEWHFLQPQLPERDRYTFERMGIVDHRDGLKDFSDTAALAALLDAVVSVDTSVAHLAGAIGRPLFVLLPWSCDWRWQRHRPDSPWYASARLVRQPRRGDWDGALASLARELDALVAATLPPDRA